MPCSGRNEARAVIYRDLSETIASTREQILMSRSLLIVLSKTVRIPLA